MIKVNCSLKEAKDIIDTIYDNNKLQIELNFPITPNNYKAKTFKLIRE